MTEQILFESELSREEYFEAVKFTSRAAKDTYRPWRVANVIGAGAGFALLFGADSHSWLAPVLLILLGLFNIVFPSIIQSKISEQGWKEYSARWGQSQYHFFDLSLRVQRSHTCNEYQWFAFKRFMETRSLFLLCRTDRLFEIIPKRGCPDVAQLRAFLDAKISQSVGGFPVVQPLRQIG